MKVLYVCTANICRSPAAAALRARPACPPWRSFRPVPRRWSDPGVFNRARAPGHDSQPLTAGLIESADLVLTAAREHRTAVVEMYPAAHPDLHDSAGGTFGAVAARRRMVDAARHGATSRTAIRAGWSPRFPPRHKREPAGWSRSRCGAGMAPARSPRAQRQAVVTTGG